MEKTTDITITTGGDTNDDNIKNDNDSSYCLKKIFDAIYNGDIDTISLLIKESPSIVNMKSDRNDFTSLLVVCRDGPSHFAKPVSYDDKTKIAKLLIDNGADVNCTSKDGRTPLMYACLTDHIDMIRLLIKNGADINITDKNQQPAMNYVMNFLPGETSDNAMFELVKAGANVPVGHRFENKVKKLKQLVENMRMKEEIATLKKEKLQIDLQPPPVLPYLNDDDNNDNNNNNDNDSDSKKYRGGGRLFHQVEEHYYEHAKKQKQTNDNDDDISYIN